MTVNPSRSWNDIYSWLNIEYEIYLWRINIYIRSNALRSLLDVRDQIELHPVH